MVRTRRPPRRWWPRAVTCPCRPPPHSFLAGTGPVGQRAARLLAAGGADVRLASRRLDRAEEVCQRIQRAELPGRLEPCATESVEQLRAALANVQLVIAAGAAGVQLVSRDLLRENNTLRVAIDLNAVPPLGLEGIEVADKACSRDGVICYGAIGVGGTKMKIHKAAVQRLFDDSSLVLDADRDLRDRLRVGSRRIVVCSL